MDKQPRIHFPKYIRWGDRVYSTLAGSIARISIRPAGSEQFEGVVLDNVTVREIPKSINRREATMTQDTNWRGDDALMEWNVESNWTIGAGWTILGKTPTEHVAQLDGLTIYPPEPKHFEYRLYEGDTLVSTFWINSFPPGNEHFPHPGVYRLNFRFHLDWYEAIVKV